MSSLLCFGDSFTWGFDPATGGRFGPEDRWPEVMASHLGSDHRVVVEGLPGRTTVVDSPYAPDRSGAAMLPALLESHSPLDVVVIMLGTNDLQVPLGLSARAAASGLWTLIDQVHKSLAGPGGCSPRTLVIAPPLIHQASGFMGVFLAGRDEESAALAGHYRTIAARAGAAFLDAGTVVAASPVDGVHLNAQGQRALGAAAAVVVADLLANPGSPLS